LSPSSRSWKNRLRHFRTIRAVVSNLAAISVSGIPLAA